MRKYEQGNENFKYVLFGVAILLYAATIILSIFNFVWFDEGGTINWVFNIINVILYVSITAIQVMGFNPSGNLITTGCVSLYITYLNFSSQLSSPFKNKLNLNDNT